MQDEVLPEHGPEAQPHAERSPVAAETEARTVAVRPVPAVVEDEEQASV